jgi:hypothetical protein
LAILIFGAGKKGRSLFHLFFVFSLSRNVYFSRRWAEARVMHWSNPKGGPFSGTSEWLVILFHFAFEGHRFVQVGETQSRCCNIGTGVIVTRCLANKTAS